MTSRSGSPRRCSGWSRQRRVVPVDTRRRVQVKEVAETARVPVEKVRPVADVFRRRDRSLLAPRAEVPLTDQLYLECNHECLTRHWNRLRQWKDRDRGYDVFLCHNSKDKPAVREIARELCAQGIVAWLDEWELRPGLPWQQIIGDVLRSIGSAAVLVGPQGVGPWQEQEAFGILQDFLQRGCPVIPVILEGCPAAPDMPYFLKPRTWVDFRGRGDVRSRT